jgi:hypothetical protein
MLRAVDQLTFRAARQVNVIKEDIASVDSVALQSIIAIARIRSPPRIVVGHDKSPPQNCICVVLSRPPEEPPTVARVIDRNECERQRRLLKVDSKSIAPAPMGCCLATSRIDFS